MNTLEETIDMMRDEFARIAAKNEATEEIKTLCQRAMLNITVRTPIIVQRDNAERSARLLQIQCEDLKMLLQEADKMLEDFGLGSQGSPLRVKIHEALK